MFNESIAYNIGYGKEGATQAEIEEAAKAARIYDRIQTFPDGVSRTSNLFMHCANSSQLGWNTVVGERGVRLSGGGKAGCILRSVSQPLTFVCCRTEKQRGSLTFTSKGQTEC